MDSGGKVKAYHFNLRVFVVAVAVLWTAVIAASFTWNVRQVRRTTLDEALIQAEVAFEKDIIYRRWNTLHGGVYARITDTTLPNPYLTVPEREVTTVSGSKLTLINPAYMTRQANDLAGPDFTVRGRITSLNPLRPENAPDEWEREALRAMERGETQVSEVTVLNGEEFMRLMRPLVTEEGCLPCHADQGYRVGDVRGGLSASVSMAPLRQIERQNLRTLTWAHLGLWILGLVGHFFGTRELVRSERDRLQAEEDTRVYAGRLEETNRLKDLFIDIMRHDLLNPAGVIKCYVGYLLESETDPRKRELAERIDLVNTKLTEMIENASKYSRLEEMESVERSRQDLGRIVRDSVSLVTCQAGSEELRVDFLCEGEYPVWVNSMIGDVFVNLTSNVYKYAASGGRLEIGILDDDGAWRVTFRDFGPGISDEDKEKIFTRFERLNKEGVKGTGLGLAIAKRLVDLHDGRIWVEDNPEGGCVFCVSLPKEAPPAPA